MRWLFVVVACAMVMHATAQQRDSSAPADAADTGKFIMHKSPLTATLLSTALPGAGQFYNTDYWKIPIIWGLGAFLVYEFISSNNLFLSAQDTYFNSPDSTKRGSQDYFNLKEGYRDNRDYYGAYFFVLYVLNILDAYVGAHLFDFPTASSSVISHVEFVPQLTPSFGVGAGIRIGFR